MNKRAGNNKPIYNKDRFFLKKLHDQMIIKC